MWQMISDWFLAIPRRIGGLFRAGWDRLMDLIADISGQTWKKFAATLVSLILAYYPIGMAIQHEVDDDITFYATIATSPYYQSGGSNSAAVTAALINREVNVHGWVMNNPFFMPSSLLDNMPSFQQGMFAALARFSIELRDQIGRNRGSSSVDADLEAAAGLLPYPGDVWIFNFSTSLLPTASAERQYLGAMRALSRYNSRVASGEAIFERRADNLLATLDRIALDIGASSAALEDHIAAYSNDWVDFRADNLFYNVKGQTYGYLMILEGLGSDFESVIQNRELQVLYANMLRSFRLLAT